MFEPLLKKEIFLVPPGSLSSSVAAVDGTIIASLCRLIDIAAVGLHSEIVHSLISQPVNGIICTTCIYHAGDDDGVYTTNQEEIRSKSLFILLQVSWNEPIFRKS